MGGQVTIMFLPWCLAFVGMILRVFRPLCGLRRGFSRPELYTASANASHYVHTGK